MKILYRRNYQWVNVTFDPEKNTVTTADGTEIMPYEIIAVDKDDRCNYLKCANCGHVVINTEEEINKHINISTTHESCISCKFCRKEITEIIGTNYQPSDNDTYLVTSTERQTLYCGFTYGRANIFSEKARQVCRYAKCKRDALVTYDDILVKYPKCFEQLYTVDALDTNRWRFTSQQGNLYYYKINHRTNLEAVVHTTGIIDHFNYQCRGNSENCYYSKEFDKLFWRNGQRYDETRPYWVTEGIETFIKKECAKIYKGE